METTSTFPKQTLDAVVEIIKNKIAVNAIYCFGYNSHNFAARKISLWEEQIQRTHFDLLVFSNEAKPDDAVEITNTISDKTNKSVMVSLLLHKLADLNTKNPCMQWFFWSVLQNGKRVSFDKNITPYLPFSETPTRYVEAIREYWFKRKEVALYHIQSVAASSHVGIELAKIAQLHQATELIALGLIRIFLGYTPNQFDLKFLLGLCNHFTTIPLALFPTQSEDQVRRFKYLCAPPSMVRYWGKLGTTAIDYIYLMQNVAEFLTEATKLAAAEIKRLEKLSNSKTNVL